MKPLTEQQQADANELELYAVNTGELYPERQRIQVKIKADIHACTFKRGEDGRPHVRYYLNWVTDAAASYQREIERRRFGLPAIRAVAIELAQQDLDEIRIGAL